MGREKGYSSLILAGPCFQGPETRGFNGRRRLGLTVWDEDE